MQSTITEELYEPESFTDAMHSADAAQWEAAIKDEYDSLVLKKKKKKKQKNMVDLRFTPWTYSHKIPLGFHD
jgi:hypothetical protein